MSQQDTLTLTLAELAARWNMTPQQVLAIAAAQPLPMYFYFDGLVIDFGDKWLRAHGDASETQDLEAHQTRLTALDIDLQRQAAHRRGQLKLTQWEVVLDDDELARQHTEAERLRQEVERLDALLKDRGLARQRQVRNGLLRAAPRTLQEIARHGQTAFPHFAFLPAGPEQASGRHLVALEDGFPLKPLLTEADLVVAMQDVLAAEAAR